MCNDLIDKFLVCQFNVCCQAAFIYLIALSASGLLLVSLPKRVLTINSRVAAANLSKGFLKFPAVPHSDVLIVTSSEQAVLLPWTAGNAAYPSCVTLPAACVQQMLSRGRNMLIANSKKRSVVAQNLTDVAQGSMLSSQCMHN